MTTRVYLPALRGRMGDWAYYSVLMTFEQINAHVRYAKEIHSSTSLATLIQRELQDGTRGNDIARYLVKNEERFFNSLVVAVYEGAPKWHEFDIKDRGDKIDPQKLSDTAKYSAGFLSLTNEETIFALDGQHRLAGIKKAIADDPDLKDEEVSVIVVAHHNTAVGLRRTRRLFTTLNKTARPVLKSEIIALDEDDPMAITTRHLLDNHKYFNKGQIEILGKTPNLSANDFKHFTTVINLYDVLGIAFPFIMLRLKTEKERAEFRLHRPSDRKLKEYFEFAEKYFEELSNAFPDLKEYFKSPEPEKILRKMRRSSGSHVLFRPMGLTIFAEVLGHLRAKLTFSEALKEIKRLPTKMHLEPYAGVIWDVNAGTIKNKNMATCRDLLLYMLGYYDLKKVEKLRVRYAKALGEKPNNVRLPRRC